MPNNNRFGKKKQNYREMESYIPPFDATFLATQIEALGLSAELNEKLIGAGITTYLDVAKRAEQDFFRINSFNKKNLYEIRDAVRKNNFSLRPMAVKEPKAEPPKGADKSDPSAVEKSGQNAEQKQKFNKPDNKKPDGKKNGEKFEKQDGKHANRPEDKKFVERGDKFVATKKQDGDKAPNEAQENSVATANDKKSPQQKELKATSNKPAKPEQQVKAGNIPTKDGAKKDAKNRDDKRDVKADEPHKNDAKHNNQGKNVDTHAVNAPQNQGKNNGDNRGKGEVLQNQSKSGKGQKFDLNISEAKTKADHEKLRPKRDVVQPVHDIYVKLNKGGKWGFADRNGKEIIPPMFDEVFNFKEDLCCFEQNERFGYIDRKGEIVIPAVYECATSFSEGYACVYKNDKCGYINKQNEIVVEFKYDAGTMVINGNCRVKSSGKWGELFIDNPNEVRWIV